ncbi:hypothetical protein [Methylobacterium radiotolerans]|uniref:hypothetical protein n=1 Tax=Methylobacterium radiotolerans TaxID=31998 RepID=UPI0015F5061D|nr:hypothetical protein [Methylobacterium radiotolerans]
MPMPDMTHMLALSGSLKASLDIAGAMVGLRDAEKMRLKAIELTAQIISAQQSALSAQVAQSDLIDRERELKNRIIELEDWINESSRYQLVAEGSAFVYRTKNGMENGEPAHYICPNCYHQRRKGIMQPVIRAPEYRQYLVCVACKAEVCMTPLVDAVTRERFALQDGAVRWPTPPGIGKE